MISASRSEWIVLFAGLQFGRFRELVATVAVRGGDAIADGCRGRQWSLSLPDRVLLVATCWRTNLTMRQIGPLFGVSHSAAHRVIDTLGPLLALAPVRKRRVGQVTIVDGTLIRPGITDWQEQLNATHRQVRARVEHALAEMKTWKILRDHRRSAHTLADTASGIAFLRNLTITG